MFAKKQAFTTLHYRVMYTPQTYFAALVLVVISMLCWGSWANISKALPKWRIEYFYMDFTLGFLLLVTVLGATLGSAGSPGFRFFARLSEAARSQVVFALLGGFLWNVGNLLMVVSIMIAGLAIAFPVTSVIAMILGVAISYWTQPIGNPVWLAAGVVVLVAAVTTNAAAYRSLRQTSDTSKPRGGVRLAVGAGILVGCFAPLVARALSGRAALDSYTVSFYFMVGAALATALVVPIMLAHPILGDKGSLRGYLQGNLTWHVLGLVAGGIWCFGTVVNFLSAKLVGMAISWGIGSSASMVAALWGIFLWKEFANSGRRAKTWIAVSLVCYLMGVVGVAIAY